MSIFAISAPVSVNAAGNNNRLGTVTSRNLTDAIINLNDSQDSFLASWVEFEVLRRNLDFDLGTMQLDQTGAWIDPGFINSGIATRAANMMGVQLDCQFCENVDVSYGDDVYGQPKPTENQAQPWPQNNEALPQRELPSGTNDVLIDPINSMPPGSGGGSGSRSAPLGLFKPIKAKTSNVTSVAKSESESKSESLVGQRQQLAPRIPFESPSELEKQFVPPADESFAAKRSAIAANSIRHATGSESDNDARPAEELIGSKFNSASTIRKTTTSPPIVIEADFPNDANTATIPPAKEVLAATQQESLDTKKRLNLQPVATAKIADRFKTADPFKTASTPHLQRSRQRQLIGNSSHRLWADC